MCSDTGFLARIQWTSGSYLLLQIGYYKFWSKISLIIHFSSLFVIVTAFLFILCRILPVVESPSVASATGVVKWVLGNFCELVSKLKDPFQAYQAHIYIRHMGVIFYRPFGTWWVMWSIWFAYFDLPRVFLVHNLCWIDLQDQLIFFFYSNQCKVSKWPPCWQRSTLADYVTAIPIDPYSLTSWY